MQRISIDRLVPHPGNANRMKPAALARLVRHLQRSPHYPAIIVRPHPARQSDYEILDGHHRVRALTQLGHAEINCDVWLVSDEQATMLLLTLNRLRGEDDPFKRAALLDSLASSMEMKELARLMPEDSRKLGKLLDLLRDPPALAPPPDANEMPAPVTFFLNKAQRDALDARLRAIDRDRTRALIVALKLGAATNDE